MIPSRPTALCVCLCLFCGTKIAAGQATQPAGGRVFVLRHPLLIEARLRLASGDPAIKPAFDKLIHDADEALKAGPFSVMDKDATPPSGDKHDYMSQGPYWWPDPGKPDGLPYIRRDGQVNPESRDLDYTPLARMSSAVRTLGPAYWFTGNDRYAEHATRLLRVWFLDEATRMNPHLRYGQRIPGRCEGRSIGIIDTTTLVPLLDAVGLMGPSPAWTPDDQRRLQDWFRSYLTWLLDSEHGRDEARQANNHGTWYDAQVAAFALFVGDRSTAREALAKRPFQRIASQIEPDGRQPLELRRTRSFSYSVMNLRGFFTIASLAEHVDVDLWHYQTDDGRSIRKALDALAPYADPDRPWPHEQLGQLDRTTLLGLLRQGSIVYREPRYQALTALLDEQRTAGDRDNLTYPPPPSVSPVCEP